MDKIAKTLQADFDAFINQPQPFGFFSGLSDYVEYILNTEPLKTIVDIAMQEKQKLRDQYLELEEQTMKELRAAEKKIREIIKDNDIDPTSITMVFTSGPNTQETHNLLNRLEEFGRSHLGHGSRKWRTYGDYLFDIVVNLSQKGYGEHLKDFTVSASEYGRHFEGPYPEDNTSGLVITGNVNGNFVFSKTEPLIYKQDARIDKESQYGAMWSVFDRLIKLHEAFSARSKGMSQGEFLNDYSQRHPARNEVEANDRWDVTLAFGDLADLNFSNEERKGYVPPRAVWPYTRFLHLDEFKGLASRAHRYLLKELDKIEPKKGDGKTTKEIVLCLTTNGDLYREPRSKYHYPMGETRDRHKIVRYLAGNKGYQSTSSISSALDGKSEKSLRTEIGKIRSNIKKLLKIEGGRVIGSKKESGYRIEPGCKITLKDQ